jgi:hypothetical protein
MATLLKVLNNLADIKSAGGVALRLRTQALRGLYRPAGSRRARAGHLPRPLAVVALIEIEINCLHKPFPRSVVGLFP